jgi:hypothetical protein
MLKPEETSFDHQGCKTGVPIGQYSINHRTLGMLIMGKCAGGCGATLLWRPQQGVWVSAPPRD